jgi:hypothetical protein
MTNADRCRARAVRYAALAERATSEEKGRNYRRLASVWREMVSPAETFDRLHDSETRQRIFTMIDAADERSAA